jgi:hypothetical protein
MTPVACQDYNFSPKETPEPGGEDTSVIDDTDDPSDTSEPVETGDPPVDETCEDRTLPGEPVDLNDECYVEYTPGTFTPVVEWQKSSWSTDPGSNNIMMMPAVGSLTDDNGDGLINDDDVPDIVVVTYGSYGTLRAISGDTGAEIWNVVGQQLQGQGAVALGDIDNDGIVEIIACTVNEVKAFEHDGTLKWTSPYTRWDMVGTSDMPAIADMDGDGNPEIIVGRVILTNTGALRGTGSYGMGASANVGASSFAADLDGDGAQEVVTGNALYDIDGNALWYNGEEDGYVAVADFDGDGQGEIVVMRSGNVRLQDTDGTVLWRTSVSGAAYGYGGPPTVADFDGDGQPEIGVAGRSNYTVLETDGSTLWERATQDGSSGNTGSAVFDFEGDGVAEVVYADETRLWVFNGADGSVKLESTQHSNATWTEYSVIADVDGDGHAEIVVPNTGSHTGFYVFGDADNSWRAGRRIWNQHAYSITNVNDDGTIPTTPDLNWLTYNNFRSGDVTAGQDGEYPDLLVDIPEVCIFDCDAGFLEVYVRVGNRGYLDAELGVVVELWGELSDGSSTVLDRQEITDSLPSGQILDSMRFIVDVSTRDIVSVWATVDGGESGADERYDECDETNNVALYTENLCPETSESTE